MKDKHVHMNGYQYSDKELISRRVNEYKSEVMQIIWNACYWNNETETGVPIMHISTTQFLLQY